MKYGNVIGDICENFNRFKLFSHTNIRKCERRILMRKKAFLALMLTLTIISSSGCQTEIKPADPKDGKYATQTSMTSLEYALYMNKQITVFTNQLSTRMAVAANHKDVQSSNESYMTQQSIETLQDTLDEVTVTKPSKEKDDSREAVMTAMETAIEHLKSYKSNLDDGKDISGYADEFQNDFNELTGLANLYNQ